MSAGHTIRRLAIVNRGEAAMRCIRSVKALRALEHSDLEAIAIYTDVDRDAPFVRHADRAIRLDAPNGAVAAYLDHDRLIALLVRAGADAVWPGWGFVSEDPDFADRVTDRGIRFLGPSGDVMRALGDKIDAKRIAEDAGIPVVPWSRGVVADEAAAARCAADLGYPVAVKAAAGGGGRGIRMVESESELANAFCSASAEAKAAFGDDRLFIERRIPRGRHIEVQIAVDAKGAAMSLGCRDCSVQRRHQKVIEEAPPPGISPDQCGELERAAISLVEHVGYVGVGTVEFLWVGQEYSFLEVNPRLQVEHGITEELTGIDLVQLQIRIGRGESLPRRRETGSRVAIEARVCAEDPQADFLPTPGRIALFDPALGPRVRLDSGVSAGCRVPAEFDSLIAKVIATGETREEARARLTSALTDFELVVAGGATNKGYLIDILETPEYRRGDFDTEWLDRTPALRAGSDDYVVEALVAASILSYQRFRDAARQKFYADPATLSPTSIPPSTGQRIDLTAGAESYRLEVFAVGAWRYRVHLDGRVAVATLSDERDNSAILELGGRSLRVLHDVSEHGLRIEIEAHPYRFTSELAGQVRSGTPSVVIGLQVAPGDRVEAGQSLGLLEAMKSEIDFRAPVSGVVKEVCVRTGQQVSSGELLLIIEAETRGAFDVSYRQRLILPSDSDPLDLFFSKGEGDEGEVPDLHAVERAGATARRAAIEASRGEIRRILMGYDVNPARGERLVALLAGPIPEGLSAELRSELAEIRHELAIFADIEKLFVRAPHASVSSDMGPSNHARLRAYMRRMASEGSGMPEAFLMILRRALTHYGIEDLKASDRLERAVLRMVASQLSPDLRRRLVLEILKRVHALAESGVHLGDDERLENSLSCISSMRGLLPDALADRAIEASYTIFEGPELERQAEQTTQEVEAWLAGAESVPSQPPRAVLVHLANAPYNVFDRVGRWLSDPNPLRRSVAVAAHICRFYAPNNPPIHTSTIIGLTHVERLDLLDGRTLLGGVAAPDQIFQALEQLSRASDAVGADKRRIHAIELLVPVDNGEDLEGLRNALAPALSEHLKADRLTLTRLADSERSGHFSFAQTAQGWEEMKGLYGLHPETADRIDLHRLRAFDCERLDSPDDIYCFHLRSREIHGDERMFVLADFRGRSPEHGHEATLHLASFERVFFDATRTLRNHLGLRDPSRRLQWNRIAVFTSPAIFLDDQVAARLARRLAPATRHLGLEKVIARLNVLDRAHPEQAAKPLEVVIADPTGSNMELSWRQPHLAPLEPARDYERKVVEARRRRLVYPYEIIRLLTGGSSNNGVANQDGAPDLPPGKFEEFDLDEDSATPTAVSVAGRPYGMNESSVVLGVVDTPTEKVSEGMKRVLVLSDPTIGMGALAAPECDRIVAAIDLAEKLKLPVEWLPVSSGARIAMDSGTENLDATARVVRRIITFTQSGGVIHIIVQGVNVGAQSYFNALATMLQHTRGALIMTASASMLLTGRAALEAAGAVSAEDETAIGGYERIMGPNGEAQFYARNLADAYRILYDHYRFTFVPPGESAPRLFATSDPDTRSIMVYPCEPEEGHDFRTLGEIFDPDTNLDRKRPFSMRALMNGVIDQDGGHLERWRSWQGAETAIVWDAHLGGMSVCLIGIESRSLPREGYSPTDGPSVWMGGTLFPLSSKKLARALNSASGNRPVVLLANLSGFDGSPESMRKLQLEYGAEIARAVVNFDGAIVFLVVSRYHGGAYVVFSGSLNEELRPAALTGSFASVIGGGPAAAVVFTREVRARAARDPRIVTLRRETGSSGRDRLESAWKEILLEKQAELAAEFDSIHSVERALEVGSLEAIVEPEDMRSYLIGELRRAVAR